VLDDHPRGFALRQPVADALRLLAQRNGNILGDLINAGLLSPGIRRARSRERQLHADSTGTLRIEIAGATCPSRFAQRRGKATLDGSCNSSRSTASSQAQQAGDFPHATGGVIGEFATVENA